MADKKDKTSETPDPFTFNADKTGQLDIPSVSKLINRKKFNESDKVEKSPRPSPSSSQKLEPQYPSAQTFPMLNTVLETDSNTQVFSSKDISIQLDAPDSNPVIQHSTPPATEAEPEGIVLEGFNSDSSSTPSSSDRSSGHTSHSSIELESAAGASPIELGTFSTASSDVSPEPEGSSSPGVVIRSRKTQAPPPALSIWKKSALLSAKDPVAQFLKNTLTNDLISGALFLAIEVAQGGKTPVFRAKAALESSDAWLPIWTGLEWNPKLIPEVWNFFVKHGFVEFSPPGTVTQLTSSRNVIRGAFGLGRNGYLTLVACGVSPSLPWCLALVSENSIQMAIDPFMSIAKS